MKVSITKESKKQLTLAEAPIARKIIEYCKEDEMTTADWGEFAVNVACAGHNYGAHCKKVYEATARISKNCRAMNAYTDDSGDLDVWLEVAALTTHGFYIVGAYLSDLWSVTGDNVWAGIKDNRAEIASRMFIRRFTESET